MRTGVGMALARDLTSPLEKILADAEECIGTPKAYRAPIEEMVLTFLDRLRRIEALRPHRDRRIG